MYPFQWALTLLGRPSSRAIGLCRAQKWGGGKALIEGSELKLHLPAACLTCKPQLLTKFRFCLWDRTISVCPTIFSFTASLGLESAQEPAHDHTLCFEATKRDFMGAKTSGQDEGFPDFCVFLLKAYLKYKSISLFFRTAGLLFSSASTKEAQYYQKISPTIPIMQSSGLFCYTGYMVEWRHRGN